MSDTYSPDFVGEMKAIEKALECYPVYLRQCETYQKLYATYMERRKQVATEKHALLYANKSRKNPYTVMFKRPDENGAQLPFLKCMACSCDDVTPITVCKLVMKEPVEYQVGVAFKCNACQMTFGIIFSHHPGKIGTIAWVEPVQIREEEEQNE